MRMCDFLPALLANFVNQKAPFALTAKFEDKKQTGINYGQKKIKLHSKSSSHDRKHEYEKLISLANQFSSIRSQQEIQSIRFRSSSEMMVRGVNRFTNQLVGTKVKNLKQH